MKVAGVGGVVCSFNSHLPNSDFNSLAPPPVVDPASLGVVLPRPSDFNEKWIFQQFKAFSVGGISVCSAFAGFILWCRKSVLGYLQDSLNKELLLQACL